MAREAKGRVGERPMGRLGVAETTSRCRGAASPFDSDAKADPPIGLIRPILGDSGGFTPGKNCQPCAEEIDETFP